MTGKNEITSLINQYSYTLDAGDLHGFVRLFEYSYWCVDGFPENYGSEELFENVISKIIIYEDGTPRTRHITTNVELSIDENVGKASGQRYLMVLQEAPVFPLQIILSGHYFDEFVRVDGVWRFSRCIIKHPLVGNMSKHMNSSP